MRIEGYGGGKGCECVGAFLAEVVQESKVPLGQGELGIELGGFVQKRFRLLILRMKREEASRVGVYFGLGQRARAETAFGDLCGSGNFHC